MKKLNPPLAFGYLKKAMLFFWLVSSILALQPSRTMAADTVNNSKVGNLANDIPLDEVFQSKEFFGKERREKKPIRFWPIIYLESHEDFYDLTLLWPAFHYQSNLALKKQGLNNYRYHIFYLWHRTYTDYYQSRLVLPLYYYKNQSIQKSSFLWIMPFFILEKNKTNDYSYFNFQYLYFLEKQRGGDDPFTSWGILFHTIGSYRSADYHRFHWLPFFYTSYRKKKQQRFFWMFPYITYEKYNTYNTIETSDTNNIDGNSNNKSISPSSNSACKTPYNSEFNFNFLYISQTQCLADGTKNKDRSYLFYLFNHTSSPAYSKLRLLPFYYHEIKKTSYLSKKEFFVFPFFYFYHKQSFDRERNYRFLGPLWHIQNIQKKRILSDANSTNSTNTKETLHIDNWYAFFPLLFRNTNNTNQVTKNVLFPFIWHKSDPAKEELFFTFLPFLWLDLEPNEKSIYLFPLFHLSSDKQMGHNETILSQRISSSVLLFLWRYQSQWDMDKQVSSQIDILYPLISLQDSQEELHIRAFPLWWFTYSKINEAEFLVIPPFYINYQDHQEAYKLIFPLYGKYHIFKQKKIEFILGPLYIQEQDYQKKITEYDLIWPIFHYSYQQKAVLSHDDKDQPLPVTPLTRSTDPSVMRSIDDDNTANNDAQFFRYEKVKSLFRVLPLIWWQKDHQQYRHIIVPLYWYFSDEPKTATEKIQHNHYKFRAVLPPVYLSYESKDYGFYSWLFPFYIYTHSNKKRHNGNIQTKYSQTKYSKEENLYLLAYLFGKQKYHSYASYQKQNATFDDLYSKQGARQWLLPLYYYSTQINYSLANSHISSISKNNKAVDITKNEEKLLSILGIYWYTHYKKPSSIESTHLLLPFWYIADSQQKQILDYDFSLQQTEPDKNVVTYNEFTNFLFPLYYYSSEMGHRLTTTYSTTNKKNIPTYIDRSDKSFFTVLGLVWHRKTKSANYTFNNNQYDKIYDMVGNSLLIVPFWYSDTESRKNPNDRHIQKNQVFFPIYWQGTEQTIKYFRKESSPNSESVIQKLQSKKDSSYLSLWPLYTTILDSKQYRTNRNAPLRQIRNEDKGIIWPLIRWEKRWLENKISRQSFWWLYPLIGHEKNYPADMRSSMRWKWRVLPGLMFGNYLQSKNFMEYRAHSFWPFFSAQTKKTMYIDKTALDFAWPFIAFESAKHYQRAVGNHYQANEIWDGKNFTNTFLRFQTKHFRLLPLVWYSSKTYAAQKKSESTFWLFPLFYTSSKEHGKRSGHAREAMVLTLPFQYFKTANKTEWYFLSYFLTYEHHYAHGQTQMMDLKLLWRVFRYYEKGPYSGSNFLFLYNYETEKREGLDYVYFNILKFLYSYERENTKTTNRILYFIKW